MLLFLNSKYSDALEKEYAHENTYVCHNECEYQLSSEKKTNDVLPNTIPHSAKAANFFLYVEPIVIFPASR